MCNYTTVKHLCQHAGCTTPVESLRVLHQECDSHNTGECHQIATKVIIAEVCAATMCQQHHTLLYRKEQIYGEGKQYDLDEPLTPMEEWVLKEDAKIRSPWRDQKLEDWLQAYRRSHGACCDSGGPNLVYKTGGSPESIILGTEIISKATYKYPEPETGCLEVNTVTVYEITG